MKRPLFLALSLLFIANAALADHIGIYSDDSGSSCNLISAGGPPFTETTAVIHSFATGATGVRFKIDQSAATGISVVGMGTTFVPIGSFATDLSVAYGNCLSGSIVVGHLQIIWLTAPSGTLSVVKPQTDLYNSIRYWDCAMVDHPATGGHAVINGSNSSCADPTAVETSTWGSVKALYR